MFKVEDYKDSQFGFELHLRVSGLSPSAIKNHLRDVGRFNLFYPGIPKRAISAIHVRSYIAALQERVAPKTVYEAQLDLRRYFRFLLEEGEIETDPSSGIKFIRYKVTPQPAYTPSEIRLLLNHCNSKSLIGIRDYALVLTLLDSGVRVGELTSMEVPDWSNRLARVKGKDGVRFVPISLTTLQSMERYVRKWKVYEGLFWRGKYGPLTTSGVSQIVKKLCWATGVPNKGVHAFRRSSAIQMKRMGMNDNDIMEIMGWGDVTMLRRYVSAVSLELAQLAHQKFTPSSVL